MRPSAGGVATGLDSLRRHRETKWIGWAETGTSRLDADQRAELRDRLGKEYDSVPVFLTPDDVAGFYHGFSNRTLWPLFHYFSRYAEFDPAFWRAYERVNRKYCDAVLEEYQPGDRIWVHDYQLMLLPGMLRQKLPDVSIGFFLHIPFPSYELYRILPWRHELLKGLLGANLIGFHTHDYVRHFLGSVHSLLGIEDRNGVLRVDGRLVLVDAFPMGIDYDRFADAATTPLVRRERTKLGQEGRRIVLSIDRLDYTKGIPERLKAFDRFLESHPEWRGKVTLICVAVPSRSRVWRYRELKRQVDGIVGDINGRWGTIEWTPVRYLYRSVPFNLLVALYSAADVALVTPLRDGMNLIAKEYLASRTTVPGVLVLSEMAGAARELSEAIMVNPQDQEGVVSAIDEALKMPAEEKMTRGLAMQTRLKRYDVRRWAEDFLAKLDEVMMHQLALDDYVLTEDVRRRLVKSFEQAERRLIVVDYDGTLVPLAKTPSSAVADSSLVKLLRKLNDDPRTDVLVISGRTKEFLEKWLGETGVPLVAEHGAWMREPGGDWATTTPVNVSWKDQVQPVLEMFVDRTPGSFIEEKDYSLAWHYRLSPTDLSRRRLQELTENLAPLAQALGFSLMDGDRVLEVKPTGIDKGSASHRWLGRSEYDFILTMGDDVTDEDIFTTAPASAWTVKVGRGPTAATFCLTSQSQVRPLLQELARHTTAAAEEQVAAVTA